MLQISEFARRAGVSVRTLRYYDEIGLLHPDRVDEQNGYRLYREAAVEHVHAIRFYQAAGVPLERIPALLAAPEADRQRVLAERRAALIRQRERLDRLIRLLSPVSGEAMAFVREAVAADMRTGARQVVLLTGDELPEELCPRGAFRWEGPLEALPAGMAAAGMSPSAKTTYLWRGAAAGGEVDALLTALAGFAGDGSSLLMLCAEGCEEAAMAQRLAVHGFLLYEALPGGQALLAVLKRQM